MTITQTDDEWIAEWAPKIKAFHTHEFRVNSPVLHSDCITDALKRGLMRGLDASLAAPAQTPTLWRYRRWTPEIDGEGWVLSAWHETRADPRATLANLNTAPLAEVVPLYAGEPVLKAAAPASNP